MLDPQDELYDRRLATHLVSLYHQTQEEEEEEYLVSWIEINLWELSPLLFAAIYIMKNVDTFNILYKLCVYNIMKFGQNLLINLSITSL